MMDELLPRVLDSVFDIYPNADRGVILLEDSSGELVPMAIKSRRGNSTGLQVSRTVVARAMERREAILSADAMIGNAVPSLLAEVIATAIRDQLLDDRRDYKTFALLRPKRNGMPPPEEVGRLDPSFQK